MDVLINIFLSESSPTPSKLILASVLTYIAVGPGAYHAASPQKRRFISPLGLSSCMSHIENSRSSKGRFVGLILRSCHVGYWLGRVWIQQTSKFL